MINTKPIEDPDLGSSMSNSSVDPLPPIIGIGASAGGLSALQSLFDRIDSDTGAAYVVVQHLAPNYQSIMAELLAKHTQMSVEEIALDVHGEAIVPLPNHVYLIPPGKDLTLCDGRLVIHQRQGQSAFSLPIDKFFSSLAREKKDESVAIILSGTGSDGSRGIGDIKENGGLIFVQSPANAAFDGMPHAAIRTGLVDAILTVEEIGEKISKLFSSPPTIEVVDRTMLKQIIQVISRHYKIDFAAYKIHTLQRRIERRASLMDMKDLGLYLQYVEEHATERQALLNDFLIGVTSFFRDGEAFKTLHEKVIKPIWEESSFDSPIRIWVPACATGEEAYTIGMLCLEESRLHDTPRDIRIFATDVDSNVIVSASRGIYSKNQVADISEPIRRRYFIEDDGQFRVSNNLRNMITFAQHDLLGDPPFAQMSLVSCRNFLIYVDTVAQQKVLNTMHFSTWPNGYIFLGPTESLGDCRDKFDIIDTRWRLFRCRQDVSRHVATGVTVKARSTHLPLTTGAGTRQKHVIGEQVPSYRSNALQESFVEAILKTERSACVVVDVDRNVVFRVGDLSPYLRQAVGFVYSDICDLVGRKLSLSVKAILHSMFRGEKKYQKVVCKDYVLDSYPDGSQQAEEVSQDTTIPISLEIDVVPVNVWQSKPTHLLLKFRELPTGQPHSVDREDVSELVSPTPGIRSYIADLENELEVLKKELQESHESNQSTTEEIQTSNEELLVTNEELQSSNEELQSVNEELHTVNAELQERMKEESVLTRDLSNVLSNCPTVMVLLDASLKIRRFTPGISVVCPLRKTDVGRHLSEINFRLDRESLITDAEAVLSNGNGIEFPARISGTDNGEFMVRLTPCFDSNQSVSAILLSFSNVTRLMEAQRAAEFNKGRLEFLLSKAPVVIFSGNISSCGSMSFVSSNIVDFFGIRATDFVENNLLLNEITHPIDRNILKQYWEGARSNESGHRGSCEVRLRDIDGNWRWVEIGFGGSLQVENSEMVGFMMDCAERKRAQLELERASSQAAQTEHLATIGTLASGVAHEFNNLNTVILGNVQLALEREEMTPSLRRSMENVMEAVAKSSNITRNLLSFARPGNQDRVQFDVVETVRSAMSLMEAKVNRVGIELVYNFGVEQVVIHGWPADFGRVVLNLLVNAIHAVSGRNSPRIEVAMHVVEGSLRLQVKDDGCGIDPKDLPHIFLPFFSKKGEHAATGSIQASNKGTGLGLSMAEAVVRKHGGSISVQSVVDKGSVFQIDIPGVVLGDAVESQAPVSELKRVMLKDVRILVIDDEEQIRALTAETLEGRGAKVETVANGLEAIEVLKTRPFDVVILDWLMPVLNGEMFLERVRQEIEGFNTPVIISSGQVRANIAEIRSDSLVSEVLIKPYSMNHMAQVIVSVLQEH